LPVFLVFLVLALSASQGFCGLADPANGGNRTPLHKMFLGPEWAGPLALGKGKVKASLGLAYGSVFINEQAGQTTALMDMEVLDMTLRCRLGLGRGMEFDAVLPAAWMQAGFMDSGLEWYHDTLGVGNYGRGTRPDNTFGYRVALAGTPWFAREEEGLDIGDVRMGLKKKLLEWDGGALAARAVVKAPSGNASRGMGSGGWDTGAGFTAGHALFEWLTLYAGAGGAWHGCPEREPGFAISINNTLHGAAGAAAALSKHTLLLVQGLAESALFEDTGISALDRGYAEISWGLRHAFTDKLSMDFLMSEDLSDAAADFSFHVETAWNF
jgi:hypothetical protein